VLTVSTISHFTMGNSPLTLTITGNPTVSIFLSVFRGFPARKAFIYICAQIVGAICAVFIAYGIYKDAIMSFDPHKTTSGDTATGKSFYTLPATDVTPATAFMTDFVSAAVM
jgi:aquaglyceroporin related protein